MMDEEKNIPESEESNAVEEIGAEEGTEESVVEANDNLPKEKENEEPQKGALYEKVEKKTKKVSLGTFFVVLIVCVLATFMATYVILSNSFHKQFSEYKSLTSTVGDSALEKLQYKISAIDGTIRDDYLYEIDDEELENSVLKGYLYGIGDKYSEYYSKEEMQELADQSNSEMCGVGISVVYNGDDGTIDVIDVFPDSPAVEAGLMAGDKIAYVKDGDEYVSVASLGYSAALQKLRGEENTKAEFLAYRDGEKEPIEFSIVRRKVTEITVTARVYSKDSKVGIIRISSFNSKTPEQFRKALDELNSKGVEKLVFDVRQNPGGELDSVCEILDIILPEGPVIRTVDNKGNEEVVYTSDKDEIKMPMAVVCNGSTASAGELFTAAIKDYNKGKIVGVQTYGKGSMQTIKAFNDGTGFKYTDRFYCPPYSDNYDGVGITPDIISKLSEAAQKKNLYLLTDDEDTQLRDAVNSMK